MNWQFTPVVLLYFILAANGLVLSYYIWNLRPARGASLWAAASLFLAIWSASEGLAVISTDRLVRLAFIRVLYLGITGFIFCWSLFIITYTNYEWWLNKYTIALLAVVPLTTFILVLFVDGHPLFYESYELTLFNGFISSQKVYGPAFWLWTGYSYLILLIGSIILLQALLRFPNLFRGQAAMLLIGVWIPIFSNVAYISGNNPVEPFDPTPLAFAVSGIFFALALRRFRFLNVVPVAYARVFKTVEIGVVVINREGHIVEMNPAAEAILRHTKDDVVGETVFKAFPEYQELLEQFQDVMETRTEISMNRHDYELRMTPLHGRAGRIDGRIIMFYDITRQKQLIKELGAYAHTVAHELKNPLALISGYASLIEETEELPEGVAESASTISQTGLKMVSVLRLDSWTVLHLN